MDHFKMEVLMQMTWLLTLLIMFTSKSIKAENNYVSSQKKLTKKPTKCLILP